MARDLAFFPPLFTLIGFLVWIVITGWQRRQRLKLEMDFNTRLLDRLGSVKDFSEFLRTDAGAQFMTTLTTESPVQAPQERILWAMQSGIVLLALGGGLLAVARHFAGRVEYDAFFALSLIAMSLGLGLVISSVASHRLASSLGVLRAAR